MTPTEKLQEAAREAAQAHFISQEKIDGFSNPAKHDSYQSGFLEGATSPAAGAYWEGQGWVNVETEGVVIPENKKLMGYSEDYEDFDSVVYKDGCFMSINDSGDLFHSEFGDTITHFFLPSPPTSKP